MSTTAATTLAFALSVVPALDGAGYWCVHMSDGTVRQFERRSNALAFIEARS